MEQRKLNDGPEVSVLSLGTWQTFERIEFDDCVAVVAACLDGGVNLFDTARYHPRPPKHLPPGTIPQGMPHAEVVLGRALRIVGSHRQEIRVADKLWWDRYPNETISDQLSRSLNRLDMDYLDIAYSGPLPHEVEMRTAVGEFGSLVRDGRAGCWGVVNWPAASIIAAHEIGADLGLPGPALAELKYSPIRREPVETDEYEALTGKYGVKFHASSSLEGGALAGRVRTGTNERVVGTDPGGKRQTFESQAPRFKQVCEEFGVTGAQASLAFCITNPNVATVVFGASTVKQTRENIDAATIASKKGAEMRQALAGVFG